MNGGARLLRLLAAAVTPVGVLVVVLIARTGVSAWGALLVLALACVWLGAVTCGRRRRRGVMRAGLAFMSVLIIVRAVAVQTSAAQSVRVHDGVMAPTSITAFVDERDPAVLAAAFLELMGALPAADRDGMAAVLDDGYRRLAEDVGFVPTLMPVTAVLDARGDDFFMITFEVPDPVGVVVFLHGSGGPFTLPCWQVAQAARAAGFSTWCPATAPRAAWADVDSGRPVVLRAVALARAHTATGVVVGVGLSAGGIGLTAMGADDDLDLDGVIAISGTTPHAPRARHPTLLIHGERDGMVAIDNAIALAAVDDNATLLRLDGNHFVLLQAHAAIASAVTTRLRQTKRHASPTSPPAGASP